MPHAVKSECLPIRNEADLVSVRYLVRTFAKDCKLSLVDETKLVTAVSELSRNCLVYGGGGRAHLEKLDAGGRCGVRVIIEDEGPGIADLEQAMANGYSTGQGLGLGLPGSRRLVDEFDIESELGKGTRITIIRWKR